MKHYLLFLISSIGLLITAQSTFAQKVHFDHDAGGNRIKRKLIVENADAGSRKANNSTLKNADLNTEAGNTGQATNDKDKAILKMNAYPNPTNDKVIIELDENTGNAETFTLKVVNTEGKALDEKTIKHFPYTLSLKEYPAGNYFISVSSEKANAGFKVLKQ